MREEKISRLNDIYILRELKELFMCQSKQLNFSHCISNKINSLNMVSI